MANSHSAPTAAVLHTASKLPDYVVERNERATSAGLLIEKQVLRENELVTWYRGTEEQWRASSFCQRRPDRPFLRTNSKMPPWDFCWFTPERGFGPGPVLRPVSNEFRGIFTEDLPDWCERIGNEISVYAMGSVVVYLGRPSALIDHKLAPPEIEEEERGWGRDGSGPVIWDGELLPDGRYVFRDRVGVRERLAQEKKAKQMSPYNTSAEMLEQWARSAVYQMAHIQQQFSRVETSSGKIYTVTRESLNEIRDVLSELARTIHSAQVMERDADPTSKEVRQKALVARDDAAFQGFLAGLQLDGTRRCQ